MNQNQNEQQSLPYSAVMFDLLTALLDSWTLWNAVAGDSALGKRWRDRYLHLTYGTGLYRPYEDVVADAARDVGMERGKSGELAARWDELQPWPEVSRVLSRLQGVLPLAIVTNCSEELGYRAAQRCGINFEVTVTAERAGYYKPRPEPYRMALEKLNLSPDQVLFVSGSAFDVPGAMNVGMSVFWHNRIGLSMPANTPEPAIHAKSLDPLLKFVGIDNEV